MFTALSGRSPATRERAKKAELRDLGTVEQLFGRVHFLLSFVPPSAGSRGGRGRLPSATHAARVRGPPFVATKALVEALAEAGVLRAREECDRDVS